MPVRIVPLSFTRAPSFRRPKRAATRLTQGEPVPPRHSCERFRQGLQYHPRTLHVGFDGKSQLAPDRRDSDRIGAGLTIEATTRLPMHSPVSRRVICRRSANTARGSRIGHPVISLPPKRSCPLSGLGRRAKKKKAPVLPG